MNKKIISFRFTLSISKKNKKNKLTSWGSVSPASGITNGGLGELLVCLRETNGLDVGCVFNSIVELKQSYVPWSVLLEVLQAFDDALYFVLFLCFFCNPAISGTNQDVSISQVGPMMGL